MAEEGISPITESAAPAAPAAATAPAQPAPAAPAPAAGGLEPTAEFQGLEPSAPADDALQAPSEAIGAPEGDYSTEGIQMPEGVTLDPGAMQELGTVCRDMNLSQKTFSTLVERMTPVLQQRQAAQLDDLKAHFLEQGRSDPELGGARWQQTMRDAGRAYAKFADAETQQVLKATGLNCHPGIIRMFKRIADQISDDAVVRGQQSVKRDPLANFYDHSNMN